MRMMKLSYFVDRVFDTIQAPTHFVPAPAVAHVAVAVFAFTTVDQAAPFLFGGVGFGAQRFADVTAFPFNPVATARRPKIVTVARIVAGTLHVVALVGATTAGLRKAVRVIPRAVRF